MPYSETRNLKDGLNEALTDALVLAAGVRIDSPQRIRNAEEFRGCGLKSIARRVREANGLPEIYDPGELFYESITTARANSTYSLPGILMDAANKILQGRYPASPVTLPIWSGIRTVQDFKTINELTLSEFSDLEKVSIGGEIPHGTYTDSKETYAVETYGRVFFIDRRDFVNDNLEAFLRFPIDAADSAARTLNKLGYDLLTSNSGVGPTMGEDSKALFYARTTPNYATSATYVLSDAGLTHCKGLMRKIKGLAGNQALNLTPRFLIVPAELEFTARRFVQSELNIIAGAAASATVEGSSNVHYDPTMRVVVEPQLDAATNGTTAWYLSSDPTWMPSIVRVFLRGSETPKVERVSPPADRLAICWRVYHDFGVAAVNWRGIVRSRGA